MSFLPTTNKEIKRLGWTEVDVILFSADAYVDHPSFGTAVIARILEKEGLKVAIVPQPNWRDDLRDFKKLGKPNLFFAISGGCMDSMVNHYTANKRLRSNDAYTAEGRAGYRPDRATVVYSRILKDLFPDTPVVIGGIEASQRRISHYDYWDDCLKPTILVDSKADMLAYGMGEKTMQIIVRQLKGGKTFEELTDIPQTAFLSNQLIRQEDDLILSSHEACLNSKEKQAENFRHFEEQSNLRKPGKRITQEVNGKQLIINPPFEMLSTNELDRIYDLPYTRLPHPRYKKSKIPAFEMIKYSITLHRGCFGACSFCTISAHQGKHIVSRSEKSILREVKKITQDSEFKGYISDLGGPSANMYRIEGKDKKWCNACKRPSCLFPNVCENLNTDHQPLINLYRKVRNFEGVKKAFVSSGIRYDLSDELYLKELIQYHVSGRLKVAPEHVNDKVLNFMRKPSFSLFEKFSKDFDRINKGVGLKQQLIPYFISSHPTCKTEDMIDLAIKTKKLKFHLEQVQDFTPTPLTLSTETYYTGIDPYTKKPVFTAKTQRQKLQQRSFFFWYLPEYRPQIIRYLKETGKSKLIKKLYK